MAGVIVVETIDEMRKLVSKARGDGSEIGFIPTMGALHEGHLSLIRASGGRDDYVVVSIFVNPTQFNDASDLEAYPRDFDADVAKAASAGAHLVFAPTVDEMYPPGATTTVSVGRLAAIVEGHFRVGHFDGVATVCTKLFSIVDPDRAYFGEKDAQQLAVIKKVVEDLDLPLEIVGCPTVREADGLAMSSRNFHLSEEDRQASRSIFKALSEAKRLIEGGEIHPQKVVSSITGTISESGLRPEYAVVVDPATFEAPARIEGEVVVAVAAFASKTRLIDNVRADVGTRKGLN
jgi:pantoate--beta-alanine ligase